LVIQFTPTRVCRHSTPQHCITIQTVSRHWAPIRLNPTRKDHGSGVQIKICAIRYLQAKRVIGKYQQSIQYILDENRSLPRWEGITYTALQNPYCATSCQTVSRHWAPIRLNPTRKDHGSGVQIKVQKGLSGSTNKVFSTFWMRTDLCPDGKG
jgi:hypothetical protein